MSYSYLVWDGEKPDTDAAVEALLDSWDNGSFDSVPPSPAIADLISTLLERWPDITEDEGIDSPWSDGPIANNASGPLWVVGMSPGISGKLGADVIVVSEATKRGLWCVDPDGPPFLMA